MKTDKEAKAFLEKQGYVVIGQSYTAEEVSHALLLLAQGAQHATLVEGVRAMALIIRSSEREKDRSEIAQLLEEGFVEPIKQLSITLTQMNEAADHFRSSALSMNDVMDEFRNKCHAITHHLSESADGMVGNSTQPSQHRRKLGPTKTEGRYRTQSPPTHKFYSQQCMEQR